MDAVPPPVHLLFQQHTEQPRSIIIVKIGGSCITDKSKFETLNVLCLEEIALQFAFLMSQAESTQQYVIVHGAGSFGHMSAKQHSLSIGGNSESNWREGAAITRRSVTKLNGFVLDALIKHKIPAVTVSLFPATCTRAAGKEILTGGSLEHINTLLENGFVPIIHGDVVFDDSTGSCSICSGDTIVKWICRHLLQGSVQRVVFLTDVAGVFSKPPHEEGARLLEHIKIDRKEPAARQASREFVDDARP